MKLVGSILILLGLAMPSTTAFQGLPTRQKMSIKTTIPAPSTIAAVTSNMVISTTFSSPFSFGNPQTSFASQKYSTVIMSSSSSSSAEFVPVDRPTKQALIVAYDILTDLYAILAVAVLAVPGTIASVELPVRLGAAAGFGMASAVSLVTAHATADGLLKSDTYKRLNLGLVAYSLISLFSLPGEAAFFGRMRPTIGMSILMTLSRLIGIIVPLNGFKHGIGANTTIKKEVAKGFKALKLRVTNAKQALTYRNILFLVLYGLVSTVVETFLYFGKQSFNFGLQMSSIGRLFLISTIIYCLKDAGERDRLSGKTFILLNFSVALFAILIGVGQSFDQKRFDLDGLEEILISIPFLVKGFTGLRKRGKST